MPVCLKCQCQIQPGEQVCPWCGTIQTRFNAYRKGLFLASSLVVLGSVGIIWTFPWFWDVLFRLGFRQPLFNFNRLEQFLQTGNWQQADLETTALLNQATRSDPDLVSGNLAWHQVKRLSCADLFTLNQLWFQYSHGRFGLSIQKQLYEAATVPTPNPRPSKSAVIDPSSWNSRETTNNASSKLQEISDSLVLKLDQQKAFRKQIGWGWVDNSAAPIAVNDSRINFSLTAPVGQLPSYGIFLSSESQISSLFSTDAFAKRQEQCGI